MAAAAVESGRATSYVDRVPRWTMVVVTPTTLHAIACRPHAVGSQLEETFASFDRSKVRMTVHGRVNGPHTHRRGSRLGPDLSSERNRIGPAHSKAVIEALEAEEAEEVGPREAEE